MNGNPSEAAQRTFWLIVHEILIEHDRKSVWGSPEQILIDFYLDSNWKWKEGREGGRERGGESETERICSHTVKGFVLIVETREHLCITALLSLVVMKPLKTIENHCCFNTNCLSPYLQPCLLGRGAGKATDNFYWKSIGFYWFSMVLLKKLWLL